MEAVYACPRFSPLATRIKPGHPQRRHPAIAIDYYPTFPRRLRACGVTGMGGWRQHRPPLFKTASWRDMACQQPSAFSEGRTHWPFLRRAFGYRFHDTAEVEATSLRNLRYRQHGPAPRCLTRYKLHAGCSTHGEQGKFEPDADAIDINNVITV